MALLFSAVWPASRCAWPALLLCLFVQLANGAKPAAGQEIIRPAVPVSSDPRLKNPIDRFVEVYRRQHKLPAIPLTSDLRFARRVWLDLQGLIPPAAELEKFLRDGRAGKRQRLVQRLLADRRACADHWLTYWNDTLRNAYQGTGFIDDGRRQITGWLYRSLYENKPYDRFVRELISPVPGSEGFIRGVVWRGVINASQRREMQAAQNIGQVFLGTNLKCASCHDSFINDWKSSQIWALASVFAERPLEIHRCDKPTGVLAEAAFLYPALGKLDTSQDRAKRLAQLSRLLTSPRNDRFAQTISNRIWAQLMGRGLVEPVDEMDHASWHPDLLNWLASDLVQHDYNLQHLMEQICTSRTYQGQAAASPPPEQADFVFHGPLIKRMSAEQFVDAVSELTHDWPSITASMRKRDGRGQGGQVAAIEQTLHAGKKEQRIEPARGHWIWNAAEAVRAASGGHLYLRKTWRLDRVPQTAMAVTTCDNQMTLFVNGRKMASSRDWTRPVVVDIASALKPGRNVLAVDAANWPLKGTPGAANPAGFYFHLVIQTGESPAWELVSDASWAWSTRVHRDWFQADFDQADWKQATVVAAADGGPWNLKDALSQPHENRQPPRVRAAWSVAGNLMRALGRPNREQVVTRRDSWATTLQGLEMTNGAVLNQKLNTGARYWADQKLGPDQLVSRLYTTALGREPNASELQTARTLLGQPLDTQGIEDLLWVLVMLDEFQLIY